MKSKYIKLKEIVSEYGIPKSTIGYLVKNKGFPKQIKISARSVIWERAAIDAWINQKKEASNG